MAGRFMAGALRCLLYPYFRSSEGMKAVVIGCEQVSNQRGMKGRGAFRSWCRGKACMRSIPFRWP